jgi:dTMP kinase
MMPGKLIVIEGADGAGKSTLQRALADKLRAHGQKVLLSREPTDGPHGSALRQAARTQRLVPERELELLLADRRGHVDALIKPALARGESVILDRYYFSTVAYQGAAGLPLAQLLALNEAFAPPPDCLLILDLPVAQSLQRIQTRGGVSDEFERPATLARVREIFLTFAPLPYATVLDATRSPAQLLADAWLAIGAGDWAGDARIA